MKQFYLDKTYSRGNRLRNGKAHRRQVRDRLAYDRAIKRSKKRNELNEAIEDIESLKDMK
jgi:hypothetical protein